MRNVEATSLAFAVRGFWCRVLGFRGRVDGLYRVASRIHRGGLTGCRVQLEITPDHKFTTQPWTQTRRLDRTSHLHLGRWSPNILPSS